MASYSGPRAASAAILWSTADETTAASDGDEPVADGATAAGGTGVATLRVTGAGDNIDEKAGAAGTRGAAGRCGDVTVDGTAVGGGTTGLEINGAAGLVAAAPVDVGRSGGTSDGIAGVGRAEAGEENAAAGAAGATGLVGFATTGGLTVGKPIIVRLSAGRAAVDTDAVVVGCGVVPVRT